MKTAIRFDRVSKCFRLRKERSRTFQELTVGLAGRKKQREQDAFWALQDISFEVVPGETLALIGPNGAGKSTALKLSSRIINPTSGQVHIEGRIGALLELGTGFHPDLTGRENIYLNASILGVRRNEIQRKLGSIIEFAELEDFIDVPVKHYSSGMYVRLGFSVAVHTEPEILLVDEVLAVGDAAFQRKCLERIDRLHAQGTTILLVSHNPNAVRAVCRRTIWLEQGRIVADGATETVIRRYMWRSYEDRKATVDADNAPRWGSGDIEIDQVMVQDRAGTPREAFEPGESVVITIHYKANQRIEKPVFGLALHRSDNIHIAGPNTKFAGYEIPWIAGEGAIQYTIPSLTILEGIYYISVSVHDWDDTKMFDYHDRLYTFQVLSSEGDQYGVMTLGGEWSECDSETGSISNSVASDFLK